MTRCHRITEQAVVWTFAGGHVFLHPEVYGKRVWSYDGERGEPQVGDWCVTCGAWIGESHVSCDGYFGVFGEVSAPATYLQQRPFLPPIDSGRDGLSLLVVEGVGAAAAAGGPSS